jgi:hypothetical protein
MAGVNLLAFGIRGGLQCCGTHGGHSQQSADYVNRAEHHSEPVRAKGTSPWQHHGNPLNELEDPKP